MTAQEWADWNMQAMEDVMNGEEMELTARLEIELEAAQKRIAELEAELATWTGEHKTGEVKDD